MYISFLLQDAFAMLVLSKCVPLTRLLYFNAPLLILGCSGLFEIIYLDNSFCTFEWPEAKVQHQFSFVLVHKNRHHVSCYSKEESLQES